MFGPDPLLGGPAPPAPVLLLAADMKLIIYVHSVVESVEEYVKIFQHVHKANIDDFDLTVDDRIGNPEK